MILLTALLMAAAPAADPACQVWQREQAFARSVREHDAAAFRAFLAEDSVFDATGAHPLRGPSAIAQAWAPMIAGDTMQLDWQPEHVVVSADHRLALSSGAYRLTTADSAGQPHTVLGRFSTTWRLGTDGTWRVQFDGGDQGQPADAAALAAFAKTRDAACPSAPGH